MQSFFFIYIGTYKDKFYCDVADMNAYNLFFDRT